MKKTLPCFLLLVSPVLAQDSTSYFRRLDQGPYIFHVGRYPLKPEQTASIEQCFKVEEWKAERRVVVTALERGRTTAAKIAHVEYRYEEDTVLTSTAFDKNGKVVLKNIFVLGSETKNGPPNLLLWVKDKNPTINAIIDSEGWPVFIPLENEPGLQAHSTQYIRDQNHLVLERRFVDANRKVVAKFKGGTTAIIKTQRDEFNNVLEESYFDADGKPTEFEGVHRILNEYDATGMRTKESRFGLNGQLKS